MTKIWLANRWYDDLERRGMGLERFGLFMACMIPVILLISTENLWSIGIGSLLLCIIGVVRCYWITKPGMAQRFPSKYAK